MYKTHVTAQDGTALQASAPLRKQFLNLWMVVDVNILPASARSIWSDLHQEVFNVT